ncbi:MAG: sugar phosphate isomerase/epimerase [Cyclobacteriaceae bacterium]|jgi:sugar phosphate isomerase/epimerase|nr:sugar phosphate isomerase/epimerase [Cyclobacteriaceae bacterium]
MKRREFIRNTALAATAVTLFPSLAPQAKRNIGLQLYSLRDVINQDVKGIVQQVAAWGYRELETYGYNDGNVFGMAPNAFSRLAKDHGMNVVSGHYLFGKAPSMKDMKGTILSGWERAVADAKEAGQKYMVVAWLDESERKTLDDYRFVCEHLNRAGEVCKKNGIRLAYHNHAFEFEVLEGATPYDLMLKECQPNLVAFEMDLYWVVAANQNPFTYFINHPGRFEQWHVKDMDKADRTRNADVGTGQLDFGKLFAQAKQAGMKHFYIEQETYPIDSKTSVKNSIANLKKIIAGG